MEPEKIQEVEAAKPTAIQEQQALIRALYPTAKREELVKLWYLSQQYGLDPVKNEIYMIGYGGKYSYLIGIGGYLKIANNHPDFDGLESDSVYQGDKLIRREDRSIFIEYGEAHMAFDHSKIIGAYANVFRKGRTIAASAFVPWKDYNKPTEMWKKFPNAMIIKTAESIAIKRAFVITGIEKDEDEE